MNYYLILNIKFKLHAENAFNCETEYYWCAALCFMRDLNSNNARRARQKGERTSRHQPLGGDPISPFRK